MRRRVAVIGYFGYRTNQLDGQTVKTRQMCQLLKENGVDVESYDTEEFQFKKISIFNMFWKVIMAKTLVYLPAHNNLKFIFPVIFILSKLFCVKIHYFVVGGWLADFVKNKPVISWMIKRIEGIHTETLLLRQRLEKEYGYNNVDVFPNFRFFDYVPTMKAHDKLKVVFFARINRMKGLDMIFAFADYVVEHNLSNKITIDFYGPIEKSDELYFFANLAKYNFINNHGVLQPTEISSELNNYDVLVLPTHYYTEGLPGSIVDAYIAGLPVVVTKWLHATEFVEDNKTGFIIPFENSQVAFNDSIMKLYEDRDLLMQMKHAANERSRDFCAENAWKIVASIFF